MSICDEKKIDLSKRKGLVLVAGSTICVALGVWLLSLEEAAIRSQEWFNSPLIIHGIGLLAVIFFGMSGVLGIKRSFDKEPGLVFNNLGVIDNSSGVSAGLIPWSEIIGLETFEMHQQKILIIKVKTPEKYIRCGSWLKQMLHKANYKMVGSPIVIASNALNTSFPELLSIFSQYQLKYDQSPSSPEATAYPRVCFK